MKENKKVKTDLVNWFVSVLYTLVGSNNHRFSADIEYQHPGEYKNILNKPVIFPWQAI